MRYSRFAKKDVDTGRYGPGRAAQALKALACRRNVRLVPIPCHEFFSDLFYAIKMQIDGDLSVPELSFRYVFADEEGAVAVISLLYASACGHVGHVGVRVSESFGAVCLYLETGCPVTDLFRDEDSLAAVLRSVAKNSGITISVPEEAPTSLCLRFERYVAEDQVVHSPSTVHHFCMTGQVSRYLSLVPRLPFWQG